MKKFIRVENNEKVVLIHNMPFDSVNGLHKTEEELSKIGFLVDDIPDFPEAPRGKIPVRYYNAEKGFYFQFEDEPPRQLTTDDLVDLNSKLDYVTMIVE